MGTGLFFVGDSMRLCRHSWAKRLITYCLCVNLSLLSFPRVASANPALIAVMAFEAPAIAELFGVLGSYLFVGTTTTVVTATTVGIAVELSRRSPTTGEAIRSGEKESAIGLLLSESLISMSDLDVKNFRDGQLTMSTERMSSEVVDSAIARYGVPAKFNPIPVYTYLESVNGNEYPKPEPSETGTGLTSQIIAPYQLAVNSMISSDDNPDYHTYIYGASDSAVFQQLLTYPSFMQADYLRRYEDYQSAFFKEGFEGYHCTTPEESSTNRYTPVSLDPLTAPAITLSIARTANTLPVMVGTAITPLPVSSQAEYRIPAARYHCVYHHETLNYKGEVIKSELVPYSVLIGVRSRSVSVVPEARFVDNSTVHGEEEKQKRFGLLPPVSTMPDLLEIYGTRQLSAQALADLYNRAWERASAQAGYQGIPYTPARAATAQMINDIRDVRQLDLSLAGALVTPINAEGTADWDIPIYNVTTNTYVSMLVVQQNVTIDIGDYPSIPLPIIDAELDLSPIINSFKWLFAINIISRKAECPIFRVDIDYLDFHDAFSSHCELLDDQASNIHLFTTLLWSMLGLFITFRRK